MAVVARASHATDEAAAVGLRPANGGERLRAMGLRALLRCTWLATFRPSHGMLMHQL